MKSYVSPASLKDRASRRRVICGCMFHHEMAALDWRVHELESVVDDFVIVESVRTHSGKPRELLHPERDPRFAHLGERMHGVVIHDPPDGPDPWRREYRQREAVWTRGAAELSRGDDDLIIISDVDEVPFPEIVDRLAFLEFDNAICARPHWFNFNWNTYLGPWSHASIHFYPAGLLRRLTESGRSSEIGRRSVPADELPGLYGWHASWFGSDDFILDKLASYAHAHDDKDQMLVAEGVDGIRRRKNSGFDMYYERRQQRSIPRLPRHAHRIATPE